MIFSENKNIVIPAELQKFIEEILSESIKLGSESSNKSKKQAQSWLNWLTENNIENLQVETKEGCYEVWNVLLCVKYDEI